MLVVPLAQLYQGLRNLEREHKALRISWRTVRRMWLVRRRSKPRSHELPENDSWTAFGPRLEGSAEVSELLVPTAASSEVSVVSDVTLELVSMALGSNADSLLDDSRYRGQSGCVTCWCNRCCCCSSIDICSKMKNKMSCKFRKCYH